MKSLKFNYAISNAATSKGVTNENLQKMAEANKSYNEIVLQAIENKLKGTEKTEANIGIFDNPNWACKEAFILGEKSALNWVLSVLKHEVE